MSSTVQLAMGSGPSAPATVPMTSAPLYDMEGGVGGGSLSPVSTCDRAVQADFLENVYGLVLANLLVTTVIAFTFTMTPDVRMFMWRHPWLLIIGVLLWAGSFLTLSFVKAEKPWNGALLFACVTGMSVGIGIFCASYYHAGWGGVVLQSLLASVAVFAAITTYLHMTRRDFAPLGGFLASGGLVVLILLVLTFGTTLAIGKRMRVQYFITSLVLCLSMVSYLLFNGALVINRFAPGDYVAAVISLYTDIVTFFVQLVSLIRAART